MNEDAMVGDVNFIKVIGVGGGGGNAVNHMLEEGINNVSFVLCNTDFQDLNRSKVETKIQIGPTTTKGLGCGANPEIGKKAAEESREEIEKIFDDQTQMVFITAGMGGGTGTGAAPVIAEIAKSKGILTVGIVTIPFKFEMGDKIKKALDGVERMEQNVDALLVINNQRLIEIYEDLTLSTAFKNADNILTESAKGIADIITGTGQINIDFADVRTVLENSGVAIMNSGEAQGSNRIRDAIEEALVSPLLNNNDIRGAKRILLYIYASHSHDITMSEMNDIELFVSNIKSQSDADDMQVIWGMAYDDNLEETVRVTIIATGFGLESLKESDADAISPEEKRQREYKKYYTDNEEKQESEGSEDTVEDLGEDIDTIDLDGWDDNDIDAPSYKK